MDTEVVRGVPRVEPLVLAVRLAGLEGSASGRKTFSYALGELIDQGVMSELADGVGAPRRIGLVALATDV